MPLARFRENGKKDFFCVAGDPRRRERQRTPKAPVTYELSGLAAAAPAGAAGPKTQLVSRPPNLRGNRVTNAVFLPILLNY
jgi:hypothetical protein